MLNTLRTACAAQGLRLSSTVLPELGNAVGPASRARGEDAARQLADEAHAQLPQWHHRTPPGPSGERGDRATSRSHSKGGGRTGEQLPPSHSE
ncbi:hypothetical protein GCM10010315_41540 [Streptomyces luteosporeus]|uniref:Uncharacterized protein n=1 Tax=Streptomyces luteosporeus TaxID=173856 RepID=A0ABN3TXR5_9ACTN